MILSQNKIQNFESLGFRVYFKSCDGKSNGPCAVEDITAPKCVIVDQIIGKINFIVTFKF